MTLMAAAHELRGAPVHHLPPEAGLEAALIGEREAAVDVGIGEHRVLELRLAGKPRIGQRLVLREAIRVVAVRPVAVLELVVVPGLETRERAEVAPLQIEVDEALERRRIGLALRKVEVRPARVDAGEPARAADPVAGEASVVLR